MIQDEELLTVKRPLTQGEWDEIRRIINEATDPQEMLSDVIILIFEAYLGREYFETATTLKPTQVAIPKSEATLILETMMEHTKEEHRSPLLLAWLNVGPSGY